MYKRLFLLLLIALIPLFPQTLYANEYETPSGIPLSEVENYVDDYVSDYIGKTTAGASIVIVKNNEIVLSKGYGFGDNENHVKIDSGSSIFEWGSISKLFVWVSVMQLVEQGKIDLDEDIRNYLPNAFIKHLKYDDPITMLDLMNHTGGFEERIFDLGYTKANQLKPLDAGLQIAEPNQIYRPGEVVAYSNYSTSLAAYIVQLITGQDFNEYVEEHIFQRLGFSDSTAYLLSESNEQIIKNKVNGYKLVDKGKFERSTEYYMSLYPSGAINGTAQDLAKFSDALMPQSQNKNVLFENEDTLTKLFSQSYSANEHAPGIAHGFWEYDGMYKGFTHGGNTTSFSSNFHIVPEEGFSVIILTNQASEVDITYGLMKELVGEKDQETVSVSNLPSSQSLEGKYISARKMESGFLHLYNYLIPLTVQSINENEIEVSLAGATAIYTQIYPDVYKMKNGSPLFIPTSVLYFSNDDGDIKQIHTSISDYLPMDKSPYWLTINAILAVYCFVFFILTPFVLILSNILSRKRKKQSLKIRKWIYLLNFAGAAFVLNVSLLIIRMLRNIDRAYTEVLPHIVTNYVLTIISSISIVFFLINLKKDKTTKFQLFLYLLTIISIVLLISLLITWQFYS
ncbi:serine hydrolase [Terribacillus saccharophilus]|nr:serine hydrolase [Terribacillus saccharophilus]